MTLNEFAEKIGYSPGTVSRAINHRGGVSEKTRQYILKKMKECGYHPNALAQSLVKQETRMIGVITPDISHNFLGRIVLAIEETLAENNYSMMLFNSRWEFEIEQEKVFQAQSNRVAGLIMKPSDDHYDFLKGIHVPVVLVSQEFDGDISSIDIENETAGRITGDYLLKCGYQRPAFLGGIPAASMIENRRRGFQKRLESGGLQLPRNRIKYCKYTISGGYHAMEEWLSEPERPDAVFCCSDASAMGVLACAADHGIRVPEELGVVGFNDDETAALPQISLTTISQPCRQIGSMAARMLIDYLESPDNWQSQKILLRPKLIERGTTRIVHLHHDADGIG